MLGEGMLVNELHNALDFEKGLPVQNSEIARGAGVGIGTYIAGAPPLSSA